MGPYGLSDGVRHDRGDTNLATILEQLESVTVEIGKHAAKRERERELPYQAFEQIRSIRVGTLRIPAAFGGPGATVKQLIEVVARLASADSNVAHALRS